MGGASLTGQLLEQLEGVGSQFRLGPISRSDERVADDLLRAVSDAALDPTRSDAHRGPRGTNAAPLPPIHQRVPNLFLAGDYRRSEVDIVSVVGAIVTRMSATHLICAEAKAPIPSPRDFDRDTLRRANPLLDSWIGLATRRSTPGVPVPAREGDAEAAITSLEDDDPPRSCRSPPGSVARAPSPRRPAPDFRRYPARRPGPSGNRRGGGACQGFGRG